MSKDTPICIKQVCIDCSVSEETVIEEINKLVDERKIYKRVFGGGVVVVWSSKIIPFIDDEPIITSPFKEPFSYRVALERLSDSQLLQEKINLQTSLRKANRELDSLIHRSKRKFKQTDEKELDDAALKWASVCQDILHEIRSKLRNQGNNVSMKDLIKNLSVNPELVFWNETEEDFETPK